MSSTEATNRHYRLEVRQGVAGWRAYARGPQGIEWHCPRPWGSREEAMEEGRDALRETGLDAWDEWMDGVTDNHIDPRTEHKLVVDRVKEAERAGVTLPDPEKEAKATEKLREMEQKRKDATEAAKQKRVQSPDVGMGVNEDDLGQAPPSDIPASPLAQQRKKASQAKQE